MDPTTNNTIKAGRDGIVELNLHGYQNGDSIAELRARFTLQTEPLRQAGKKVLVLADVSGVTDHNSDARDQVVQFLHDGYTAVAIVGADVTNRMIINWLVKLAGQGQRVQIFDNKHAAIAWLKRA